MTRVARAPLTAIDHLHKVHIDCLLSVEGMLQHLCILGTEVGQALIPEVNQIGQLWVLNFSH